MSALVTVGVNTFAFYLISELLPGFEIKNKKKLIIIAVIFSILTSVSLFLLLPLSFIINVITWVVGLIPFIGGFLASAGHQVATFFISTIVTMLLLVGVDKLMDDFRMKSLSVAFIASILIAVINVVIRAFIG